MCAREIHPWASVTIGPTGAMPADFWTKIGASASTLVNVLVCASQPSCLGQMIYRGLVALGTFLVDLARAIVDWGMRQLGALWNTVVAVAQKATQVLAQVVTWAVDFIKNMVVSAVNILIKPVVDMIAAFVDGVAAAMGLLRTPVTPDLFATVLTTAIFGSQLFFALLLLTVGFSVAEKITMVASGGIGTLVIGTLIPIFRDFLIAAIVGILVVKVLNSALPRDDQIANLVPSQFETAGKLTFGFAAFLAKFGLLYAAVTREFKSLPAVESGFFHAVAAFIVLLASMTMGSLFDPVTARVGMILLDGAAIYLAFFAAAPSLGKAKGPLTRAYPLMFPVSEALNIVGMVSSVASLIGDVATLGDLSGYW